MSDWIAELKTTVQSLVEAGADSDVTLAMLLERLGTRGVDLLTLTLMAPFMQPIPVWGVSTVFGVVVAVLHGLALFGRRAALPRRLAQTRVSPGALRAALAGIERLSRLLAPITKYGQSSHVKALGMGRIAHIVIVFLSVLLLLPLPVPFSNFLPAAGIVLLSLARLSGNWLMYLLGSIVSVANGVVFAGIFAGFALAIKLLLSRFC